jgi:prepilin-type processing-associated H-X9-DG protein
MAIIAILAGILFPVFTQAKAAAQKTADLSNTRQIGQAALLYEGDSDDNFPTYVASFCPVALVVNPIDHDDRPDSQSGGRHPMWQFEIHPYIKSWNIYFAPSDVMPKNSAARFHNLSYAYNYGYLSKLEPTQDPSGCGINGWFSSRAVTSVNAPGSTIAFTDGAGAATFQEAASVFGNLVNPPDAMHSSELFYGLPQAGWGASCLNYYSGSDFAVTDGFSSRYFGGGNVSFVDGHAGHVKVNGAAIGTNFDATVSCTQTKVTDSTKYLWDPRGPAAPSE